MLSSLRGRGPMRMPMQVRGGDRWAGGETGGLGVMPVQVRGGDSEPGGCLHWCGETGGLRGHLHRCGETGGLGGGERLHRCGQKLQVWAEVTGVWGYSHSWYIQGLEGHWGCRSAGLGLRGGVARLQN